MTTAAECNAVAGIVAAHGTKQSLAGSLKDQGFAVAKAANILTAIGGGANQATAYKPNEYSDAAAAVLQASRAAAANGNQTEAMQLRTANMILINLSQGL